METDWVTHICASKQGHHWWRSCWFPSHYLERCRHIFNWSTVKFQSKANIIFKKILLKMVSEKYDYNLNISICTTQCYTNAPWWRNQMQIFFALLAFVRGIHRSPVNSPHKGQWREALMFSLIFAWTNAWVNNREAGDLRRHCAH